MTFLREKLNKLKKINESAATAVNTVIFKAKGDSALSDSMIRKAVALWDKEGTLTEEGGVYTYTGDNAKPIVKELRTLRVEFVNDPTNLEPETNISESSDSEDDEDDELKSALLPAYEKLKKVMESDEFDAEAFGDAYDEFTDKCQECMTKKK